MTDSSPFRILLYYQFVRIEDPVLFAAGHLAFCQWLELRGRVIVAHEGINGTVSGTVDQTSQYIAAMRQDSRFQKMEFKIDEHDGHAFRRLSVKARDEIVTFGRELHIGSKEPDILSQPAKYLEPLEFRKLLDDPNVVVIDGRNDYEFDLGHFRGAIRPDFETFKQAPEWLEANLKNKKQPILTYCTGGIRCEKLSAYLLDQGFENVYQLHGGIVEYGRDPEVQGDLFDGACFVFDDRIAVPVNRTESATIVGRCHHCGEPSESYVNCANVLCNLLYLCCPKCEAATERSCSEACRQALGRRPKNGKLSEAAIGS